LHFDPGVTFAAEKAATGIRVKIRTKANAFKRNLPLVIRQEYLGRLEKPSLY
jgi:hypothetical protein